MFAFRYYYHFSWLYPFPPKTCKNMKNNETFPPSNTTVQKEWFSESKWTSKLGRPCVLNSSPMRGRHKAFFVKLYYFNIALHGESAASSFVDLLQYSIKWMGGAAGNHVSATLFYALRWWCTHLKPMFRPRATTYYRSLHITIYTFSDEYYYEPCVQNNYNFAAAAPPRNIADRWRNIRVQKTTTYELF